MTLRRTLTLIATGTLCCLAAGAHAQQPPPAPGTPPATTAPAAPAAPAPATGAPAAVQVDASSIVGSTVRSTDGRDIGKVSRLMLDPQEGRVTTVIMTIGGTLGMGGETVSVPWSSVRLGQDGRNLVVMIDRQVLESVPSASPRSDPGRPPRQ